MLGIMLLYVCFWKGSEVPLFRELRELQRNVLFSRPLVFFESEKQTQVISMSSHHLAHLIVSNPALSRVSHRSSQWPSLVLKLLFTLSISPLSYYAVDRALAAVLALPWCPGPSQRRAPSFSRQHNLTAGDFYNLLPRAPYQQRDAPAHWPYSGWPGL